MKSLFLKIFLLINLFFLNYSCKAQTANDYITFYNGIVPKLNIIAANKTQFYGQNFSTFYSEIINKNIQVVRFHCDRKTDLNSKFYVLRLFFEDDDLWGFATKDQNNLLQYPWVSITFENEIPKEIEGMVKQNFGLWNSSFATYFSDMKIETIDFIGVNGYNSNDWSGK